MVMERAIDNQPLRSFYFNLRKSTAQFHSSLPPLRNSSLIMESSLASERGRPVQKIRFVACICLRLVTLAIFIASVFAQSNRAVIVGTVLDPSGSSVANAQVTITNLGTNIESKVLTAAEGQYTVTNLDPGNYSVTVTAAGFKENLV